MEHTLTWAGWKWYEELKRGRSDSNLAFMAMDFKHADVARAFAAFKEAVRQTGFNLRKLDDRPEAGLIDNRLRVELRRSRFVIADLTGGNSGAYWESGFGEGLGRPVIYTCEKGSFETQKTHFDTNHLQTVKWDTESLAPACDELKATIRNSLPGEAKMDD